MNDLKRIKNSLLRFGLNQNQTDIYVLLLRKGSMRINEISDSLQIPRSSVYESLKGLSKKELAEEIIENNYKTVRAYPIGSIRHILEDQIEELNQQHKELDHLEKTLDILPAIQVAAITKIRYYSGRAGARQIFWNSLKTKDRLSVYSEWGRGRYLGIKFYQNFVAESFSRGFDERVITNSRPEVIKSIQQHTGTTISRTIVENIRTVEPGTINIKGETLMYDNIYAQVYLKNEQIHGFEIENAQFVKSQRAIFKVLWEQATPIKKLL